MKANYATVFTAIIAFFLGACDNNSSDNNEKELATETVAAQPLRKVTINTISSSPDFPGARLTIGTVKNERTSSDSVKVIFNFKVEHYELKLQTADNGSKMCNNSDKGQHIHFIMDNAPYKALYEPANEVTVAKNSEHYLVAFLSRSYHESIKTKDAAIMYRFKIDEKGNMTKLETPKTPMLTYSRPKGDYIENDTTNILLDFYVWNCLLAPDGYKIKAIISNLDRNTQILDTTIVNWSPYFIQNLGTGKCKVELTLIDKAGNPLMETKISREFTLKAQ